MKKILCALTIAFAATSAMACKCPEPKKQEPLVCKTHEEYNAEEIKQREQERIDRMRMRQQKIKDAFKKLEESIP